MRAGFERGDLCEKHRRRFGKICARSGTLVGGRLKVGDEVIVEKVRTEGKVTSGHAVAGGRSWDQAHRDCIRGPPRLHPGRDCQTGRSGTFGDHRHR